MLSNKISTLLPSRNFRTKNYLSENIRDPVQSLVLDPGYFFFQWYAYRKNSGMDTTGQTMPGEVSNFFHSSARRIKQWPGRLLRRPAWEGF